MSFWQEVDGLLLRQAAIQADRIRAAIVESVPVDDIVDRWAEANPNGGTTTPDEARTWANLNAIIPLRPLKDALDHVYATGWVMGDEASTAAYAHAVTGINKAAPSAQQIKASIGVNWDKWKPGNKPAALLVRPPGAFAALVESGGATVQGINKTIADRMGTLLAKSLESGEAYTAASKRLLADSITSKIVKNPLHAEMIAVTEMSRSFNTVAVNNYTNFGVEKVEWLAIDTRSCSICPSNMAQGPITLGEAFQSGHVNPPAHPHCRCTLIPVVDEGEPMTDEQFAQALIEGKQPPMQPITTVEPTPTGATRASSSKFKSAVYEEAPQLGDLTAAQKSARREYIMSSTQINRYLRGQSYSGDNLVEIAKHAQELKAALAVTRTTENMTVMRYSGTAELGLGVGVDYEDIVRRLDIGSTINYKSFISTSAPKYINGSNVRNGFEFDAMKLNIQVPAGSQAASLNGPKNEAEILLQANSTFVVTKISQAYGKIVIDLLLTGQP